MQVGIQGENVNKTAVECHITLIIGFLIGCRSSHTVTASCYSRVKIISFDELHTVSGFRQV